MLKRNKALLAVVILQCLFFIGWAMENEGVFTSSEKEIMVKLEPVDPRDFLSGQYMSIGYDFTRPSDLIYERSGLTMWAELKPKGKLYVFSSSYSKKPDHIPEENILIKGTYNGFNIEYGIEKYFVPEGTETPNFENLTAKLAVNTKSGRAKLKQVYISGKEWP